jgi:hypothetical protein
MSWVAAKGAGPPPPNRTDVVWRAGTTAIRDDDGRVRIVAHHGTVLAQVGGGLNALMAVGGSPPDSTTFACRFGEGTMVWSMSNRPADLLLFVTHSFSALRSCRSLPLRWLADIHRTE